MYTLVQSRYCSFGNSHAYISTLHFPTCAEVDSGKNMQMARRMRFLGCLQGVLRDTDPDTSSPSAKHRRSMHEQQSTMYGIVLWATTSALIRGFRACDFHYIIAFLSP